MSWSQTLQDASFKGFVFEIVKTDDTSERATVEHSYPYVDGADVEDMGRSARRTSVEAIFYGINYEISLQAFLAILDQPGSGEFIHPVFGSIKNAQATRSSIHHDADNPDQASFTIEFVESTPNNPFFSRTLTSQKIDAVEQHGANATAAATSQFGSLIDRLRAANPLATLDKLRASMTGPLLAGMAQINAVLSGLDPLIFARAWVSDIYSLVNGVLSVRSFVNGLGSQWDTLGNSISNLFGASSTGSSGVMSDWAYVNSALTVFEPATAAQVVQPAQVSASIPPTEAQAIAAVAATIKVNTAVGLANAASYVLGAEFITPTLSPAAIETIANTARAAIEVAIEQVRTIYGIEQSRTITEPLKYQALALQEAARAVIEARPPLVRRTIIVPGNLRLTAHLLYGDHTRAPELYRLNNPRSPFVEAGDIINAYAS